MSHKEVRIPSQYGPIVVTVVGCDRVGCAMEVQEDYMVGWHKLGYQGVSVASFGDPPDDMDFCSMTCLHHAVNAMMGGNDGS